MINITTYVSNAPDRRGSITHYGSSPRSVTVDAIANTARPGRQPVYKARVVKPEKYAPHDATNAAGEVWLYFTKAANPGERFPVLKPGEVRIV